MRLNLGEITTSLGCSPGESAPWADLVPTGAQIDSRKVQPGNLFFCLPGEHVDGHDFAFAAAKAGAIAIVASRNPWGNDAGDAADLVLPPVFLVDNVRHALARVATRHRETCLARIIGITGTAGKTSVKEVLAQVLERRGRTERNPLNLNNQIGLPVSMLNASAAAAFWVMEMGISEAGDMDELGEILRPDVGVILNVGDGHVSGLGELGVAAHKARLLDYIQLGGVAVVSRDYADLNRQVDERRSALARRGVQVLRFSGSASVCRDTSSGLLCAPGQDQKSPAPSPKATPSWSDQSAPLVAGSAVLHDSVHCAAAKHSADKLKHYRDSDEVYARAAYAGPGVEGGVYKVWSKDVHFAVTTPFRGDFGSENVAAIAAVAIKLGLSQEAISEGFASARLPEQRFRAERYPRCTLLDDSYNANPLSSSRMLQAARSMADEYGQFLLLVMGEMLELGSKAESAHEALGETMAAVKPEMVFWKGGQGEAIARGLRKGGYSGKLYPLSGAQEFDVLLEESDLDNVLVLFKGSRGNKLERLVAVFREKVSPAGEN
ncbi:MAG: Mur ligase family protein [Desulfovibrionaceae bacterium]|nr:Mur ligase family protein [Desulfovibrionaceae bacterium]